MFVKFGRFLPDQPDFKNPGLLRVENALPIANGYIPVPELVAGGVGGSGAQAKTIAGLANAMWVERESGGTVFVFAGDGDNLYEADAGVFVEVSRVAGYTIMDDGDQWRHARYGDDLFAVNGGRNDLQIYNLPAGGVAGLFSDAVLAGTTPPGTLQGKYIGVVRDFLVLAYVSALDGGEGSTLFPYRVHWSALGDPLDYIPSLTTQAGFQDIPDLGEIRGFTGGEYGTILLENGLVRMDFLGPPTTMQFDQIEGAPGCFEPRSVIRVKNQTYWYSPEGWMMFDGQNVQPIGTEKVDRFFAADARTEDYHLMSVSNIVNFNAIAWGYVSSNNSGDDKIDTLLLYNYDIGEWGIGKVVGVDTLGEVASPGFDIEQLDPFAFNPAVKTTLSGALVGAETVIPVTSVVGWVLGYGVGILLDDTTYHFATVTAVGASDLTIDVAVPSAAAGGNNVQNSSIDLLVASLDSRLWKGGAAVSGAIKSGIANTFTGAPGDALFEPGDVQPVPNGESIIKRLNPAIEGSGVVTAQVGYKETFSDGITWGDEAGLNARGFIPVHGFARRLHRIRTRVTGSWSACTGTNVEAKPAGQG